MGGCQVSETFTFDGTKAVSFIFGFVHIIPGNTKQVYDFGTKVTRQINVRNLSVSHPPGIKYFEIKSRPSWKVEKNPTNYTRVSKSYSDRCCQ